MKRGTTKKERTLKIEWQRLVIEKKTCPRCRATEKELAKAVGILGKRGIKVRLKKKEINKDSFKKDPQASNRILIDKKPLEYWLQARTGKSSCCSVCKESECRTVETGGSIYETIPAKLIVKAAKKAAEGRVG